MKAVHQAHASSSPLSPSKEHATVSSQSNDGGRCQQNAYGRCGARTINFEAARAAKPTLKTAKPPATPASTGHGAGMSLPTRIEQTYLVSFQLRNADGNAKPTGNRHRAPARPTSIRIITDEWPVTFELDPSNALTAYIPQAASDGVTDGRSVPEITDPGTITEFDPVVHNLALALLSALNTPQFVRLMFLKLQAFANRSRPTARHGDVQQFLAARGSRLTARQEQLARSLLIADLTREPSIADIASACGLPVRRFIRAFRQTTGMPPYRWLRAFRVDHAKELLLNTSLPLSMIAYDCGFADQSHFTRIFRSAVTIAPGAWRRAHCA
jgi:AraC family transcriptional regulator